MIRGGELLGYVSIYEHGIDYTDEIIEGEKFHIVRGTKMYKRGLPIWNDSIFEIQHKFLLESWEVPPNRRWRLESVKWV